MLYAVGEGITNEKLGMGESGADLGKRRIHMSGPDWNKISSRAFHDQTGPANNEYISIPFFFYFHIA